MRRATVGVLALAALWAPGGALRPARRPPRRPKRLAFAERYRATQHGGIVRAANAAISCRAAAGGPRGPLLPGRPRGQGHAVNNDFDMFYVDVDDDPNTYNSSRAEVRSARGRPGDVRAAVLGRQPARR